MWVIGMVVCIGLMLVGHGLGNHGAHSNERAAAREPAAIAPAPDGAVAEAAPESGEQPGPAHHHHRDGDRP